MIQRGRKSASAQAVVVIEGGFLQRPEPPEELTPTQAGIWREIVSGEPTDFFSTAATRTLLRNLCRHTDAGNQVSDIINSFQAEWLKNAEGAKRYQLLLRMREMETRAAASMATKLRLTNQSRYQTTTAARAGNRAAKGAMPWDDQ
jgi:hypothetical protein